MGRLGSLDGNTPQVHAEAWVAPGAILVGRVTLDQARHRLVFDVEAASFPNWEGKRQVRDFTYENGLLSYAVPASASGSATIAYSIWRRAAD